MKGGAMGDANNRIRNTKPKDSSAKLIFDDHVLCAQFLQDYVDVGILRNVEPEDIEDISERFPLSTYSPGSLL
ncbi:hypothetical protein INF30_09970 [Lachnospiraceae bacterium DSM 108991]|uniref:Uncharacterized protein n=1 Tax=Claveliimonas monacensis TaxID=2779351 RepID=A0ABR9RKZ8_9FIRM|nr:hypothetical protein [Claveliimonas monacensis]MBE5063588.1 hypothetical protein [Claveliimonas monacensis]